MRHVMALRVSKAVLVFAIALFYTILVLNNITDYGSNYEFVGHVLMMDSTFPGNHGMWRAINSRLYIQSFTSASSLRVARDPDTMGQKLLQTSSDCSSQFTTGRTLRLVHLTAAIAR